MTFSIHFILCNFFLSLLLGFILLSKKLLKKHITLDVQYRLWYVFVFALFLPFIPYKFSAPQKLFLKIQQVFSEGSSGVTSTFTEATPGSPITRTLGIQDFSTTVSSSGSVLSTAFFGIWITGMLCVMTFFIYTMVKIHTIRKHSYPVTKETEPDLYNQYSACLWELHIKRNVRLYASCKLSSPVSYGWIYPVVIIPQDFDILLSERDIRFIFLHELQHYKRHDTFLNTFVCLLQIIYWFNPFIWFAFRHLKNDREIACDNAVIEVIGNEQCLNYGYTILKYVEQMNKGLFLSPVSTISGSTGSIKQRIMEISDYKIDSVLQKTKSMILIIFTLLLVYCSSPLFTSYASQNASFHLTNENWKSIDVSSYFGDANGAFVLYNVTQNQYQIYNQVLSEKRVSPNSTFKIYSGLFGLEEQIISPESSLQKWNGTRQNFDSWNQNQTLDTAMKNSVNWYFQNLDSQLKLPALYSYYNKISYGNCDLTGGTSSYWAESSLKISPIEQVILLSDLLQNKWDFKEQNVNAIKESLFISETPLGRLYGKTGTGQVNGQNANGWFVGFVENENQTYCFATNLQDSEDASGKKASEITVEILNQILASKKR